METVGKKYLLAFMQSLLCLEKTGKDGLCSP
jgi:hypothetical protein